jgi:hypothetical protein
LYVLPNANALQANICGAGQHDGYFTVEKAQHKKPRAEREQNDRDCATRRFHQET